MKVWVVWYGYGEACDCDSGISGVFDSEAKAKNFYDRTDKATDITEMEVQ